MVELGSILTQKYKKKIVASGRFGRFLKPRQYFINVPNKGDGGFGVIFRSVSYKNVKEILQPQPALVGPYVDV